MKISAILTVYNGQRYLEAAIQSVLKQDRQPDEILIIDDGSTDTSMEIASRFGDRLRIVRHKENKGLAEARNSGVSEARGDVIAFLDCDDCWHPAKTSCQEAVLLEDESVVAVYSHARNFVSDELDAATKERLRCSTKPLPHWIPPGGLIRRSVFEKVGPFLTKFDIAPCMEWTLRLKETGLPLRLLSEVHYKRRIHGNNYNFKNKDSQSKRLHIIKAALDRRRAEAANAQSENGN